MVTGLWRRSSTSCITALTFSHTRPARVRWRCPELTRDFMCRHATLALVLILAPAHAQSQAEALSLERNLADANSAGGGSRRNSRTDPDTAFQLGPDRANAVLSVKDFGATCNGSGIGDQAAFDAAMAAVNSGTASTGRIITIPVGICMLRSSRTFPTTEINGVASITLQGNGQHNTILDFSGAPTDSDGISINGVTGIKIRDLKVQGAPRDNISIIQAKHVEVWNVRSQGAGRDGLRLTDGYMVDLGQVYSLLNAANGFTFGIVGGGGSASGYSTSIHGYTLYAQLNGLDGFAVNNIAYSSFAGIGSDSNRYGYTFANVAGVTCTSCGAEANHAEGFYAITSNATARGATTPDIKGLTLIGPVAVRNSTASRSGNNFGLFAAKDSRALNVTIIGGSDMQLASGITRSLTVANAPASMVEINNTWIGTSAYLGGATRSHLP